MAEGSSRREFLGVLGGSLLLSSAVAARNRIKPNVLVVIADEWRYQSTGYGGDPNVSMPNIDRFASQSINFENAISGCSICCPARASIVTGQYPLTNGVYVNDVPLRLGGALSLQMKNGFTYEKTAAEGYGGSFSRRVAGCGGASVFSD